MTIYSSFPSTSLYPIIISLVFISPCLFAALSTKPADQVPATTFKVIINMVARSRYLHSNLFIFIKGFIVIIIIALVRAMEFGVYNFHFIIEKKRRAGRGPWTASHKSRPAPTRGPRSSWPEGQHAGGPCPVTSV